MIFVSTKWNTFTKNGMHLKVYEVSISKKLNDKLVKTQRERTLW